jgi:lysozyme family protein
VVDKLPYKFSYRFVDAAGKKSQLQIIDWEIGALYWKCLRKYSGYDEKIAIAKVRAKYLDSFSGKDLYFFLGTTLRYHAVSPNPYLIIGVFYPPFQDQLRLF